MSIGRHRRTWGQTIADHDHICLVCGAPAPAPTITLCSERCTSRAQQEVQANAASVRVGTDGEERQTLLRRNARLMEAMLHHRPTGAAGSGRDLASEGVGPDADPDEAVR